MSEIHVTTAAAVMVWSVITAVSWRDTAKAARDIRANSAKTPNVPGTQHYADFVAREKE